MSVESHNKNRQGDAKKRRACCWRLRGMNMEFLKSEDYEESVEVIKQNMASYYEDLNLVWDDEKKLDRYKECSLWGISVSNDVVGFFMVYETTDTFYLAELHIDSSFRNNGYGTEALRKIRMKAAESGYSEIRVGAFKGSLALNLYENFGFKREKKTDYTHELVAAT